MAGFDGQFILKYVYASDRFTDTSVIINGTKAIFISLCKRINFIDSLNYFHDSLSKLPELFGIEDHKGTYPHLFDTDANANYIGKLPAKQFYMPESMSLKAKAVFDKWYDSHSASYVFDNKKKLIAYCVQDVAMLRKACMKFSTDFWQCTQIDPFLDGVSIASVCSKVFRSKFLEENTIGVIPTSGYRYAVNQSMNRS